MKVEVIVGNPLDSVSELMDEQEAAGIGPAPLFICLLGGHAAVIDVVYDGIRQEPVAPHLVSVIKVAAYACKQQPSQN